MLLQTRREPYRPLTKERLSMENQIALKEFEQLNEEGVMFVAEEVLPPWRKTVQSNLAKTRLGGQSGVRLNLRGFRVQGIDKQDEPGFPTYGR